MEERGLEPRDTASKATTVSHTKSSFSLGSLVVLPFLATLNGVFPAQNRDAENLALALLAMAAQVLVALGLAIIGASSTNIVIVVGAVGSVASVEALVYRAVRLIPSRSLVFRHLCEAGAGGIRNVRSALAEAPHRADRACSILSRAERWTRTFISPLTDRKIVKIIVRAPKLVNIATRQQPAEG